LPKLIDLTGKRFGRLSVIRESGRDKHNKPLWVCLCDCGEERTILGNSLSRNKTKSCGCLQSDTVTSMSTKHGHAKRGKVSTEHIIWSLMIQRCTNENATNYKYWGGRGISVCDRWLHSFENFLKDMGERPSINHSLDRKENDGNYEPSNCRWATRTEQVMNRRPRTKIS
jgi:hypothetical protein